MQFRSPPADDVRLQMTPMIDIVFQLMVFFVFTFKISLPEGDFSIRMPAQQGAAVSSESPVIRVQLRSDADRNLAGIRLGDVAIGGADPLGQLRARIRALIDDSAGPGSVEHEVEIVCDYDLRYRYVMDVMTAVTGYLDPATGQLRKLVEKVRFAPLEAP